MILSLLIAMSAFKNVEVVRVLDGDTFVINLPDEQPVFGEDISVRIKGIDAPEIHDSRVCMQKKAVLSKEALTLLLAHGTVELNFCERDKYFRILCAPRIDKKYDAGSYMLERKLAVPYSGETKLKQYCNK